MTRRDYVPFFRNWKTLGKYAYNWNGGCRACSNKNIPNLCTYKLRENTIIVSVMLNVMFSHICSALLNTCSSTTHITRSRHDCMILSLCVSNVVFALNLSWHCWVAVYMMYTFVIPFLKAVLCPFLLIESFLLQQQNPISLYRIIEQHKR